MAIRIIAGINDLVPKFILWKTDKCLRCELEKFLYILVASEKIKTPETT